MDLNYPLTRYLLRPVSRPLASLLARTAATPLQVSWVSALLTLGAGVALALGSYLLGAGLALAGLITDCVDGDLARITDTTSRRGAFFDSVLDRWTDAALICGLALSDFEGLGAVAMFALLGAFLTSYTRARAQSLGADCPEGIATRDVRMIILLVAIVVARPWAGLAAVAVLGAITSLHRMISGMGALKALDRIDRDPDVVALDTGDDPAALAVDAD